MKKIIGIILLLVLLCAPGCVQAEGKTTTLLVYMCGTDLQEDACQDLVEMAEVEAGTLLTWWYWPVVRRNGIWKT